MDPKNVARDEQTQQLLGDCAQVNHDNNENELSIYKINLPDFDRSAAELVKPVRNRFIVSVPNIGTEKKEVIVKDRQGNEKKVIGMAFQNDTDSALQAVGKGVLIFAVNTKEVDIVQFSTAMLAPIESFGGVAALNKKRLTQLISIPQN